MGSLELLIPASCELPDNLPSRVSGAEFNIQGTSDHGMGSNVRLGFELKFHCLTVCVSLVTGSISLSLSFLT